MAWRLVLQYADPWMPFPFPVSLNADGVGAPDTRTGTGVHGNSSNFQIHSLVCWIRSLPIVSVLQTCSSQMFVSNEITPAKDFFFFCPAVYIAMEQMSNTVIIIIILMTMLKPQDSFGEFNKFFLDLQKVHEIIRKHHQTFLKLFWLTYCNAILPSGIFSLCT